MRVQRVEEGRLVCTGDLKAIRGGEPLVDLSKLGGAIGELVEGGHGSAEGTGEPDGARENTCGEQRDGGF